MKKIGKILIAFLAFIVLIGKANASYTPYNQGNEGVPSKYSSVAFDSTGYLVNSGITIFPHSPQGIVYTRAAVDRIMLLDGYSYDNALVGYCIEPDRQILDNLTKKDINTSSEMMKAYKLALQAIIYNGCSSKTCPYKEYAATSYAIRAAAYVFFNQIKSAYNSDMNQGHRLACAIYNLALEWKDENEAAAELFEKYNKYSNHPCADGRSLLGYKAEEVHLEINNSEGQWVINEAKRLFNLGVEAALNGTETTNSSVTAKLVPTTTDVSPETGKKGIINRLLNKDNSNSDKTYTVSIVFDVKNMKAGLDEEGNKNSSLTIDGLQCDSCQVYDIKFDNIKASNGDIITSNKDLLEYLQPDENGYYNGQIILYTQFVRNESAICVPQIPFKINYRYTISSVSSTSTPGGEIVIISKDGNTIPQQFVAPTETMEVQPELPDEEPKTTHEPKTGRVTGIITCEEPDEEEEETPCDEVTKFVKPICQLDEADGGGILQIYAPENVKDCVLNNVDDADNSYRLTEAKGGVSNDNAYCAVYCKEDYSEIYLDNVKDDVTCGGVFDIKARINGDKMCYVAGKGTGDNYKKHKDEINVQKFGEDILNIQVGFVEAYNSYLEAKSYLENMVVEQSSCGYCSGNSCAHKNVYQWKIDYKYQDYKYEKKLKYEYMDEYYGWYILELELKDVHLDEEYKYKDDGTCGYKDGKCESTGSCSDSNPSPQETREKYTKQKNEAEQAMIDLSVAYAKAISDIQECSGGWNGYNSEDYDVTAFNSDDYNEDKDFLKDVNIRYYYNEHQGENEYYTPYYDIIKNQVDDTYLEVEDKSIHPYEQYWFINTNQGILEYGADDTYANEDDTRYNRTYQSSLHEYDFAICDTSGCTRPNVTLSRSLFIQRSVNSKYSYRLPTQFYDVGSTYNKIVYSDVELDPFDPDVDADPIPLEHEVPITFNACIGGEFDLFVENLGQFYDDFDINYGRLINCVAADSGDNKYICDDESNTYSVARYQEDNQDDDGMFFDSEVFNGRYICNYNTDCDCEQDADCDSSFGGKYYYLNEQCKEVEIACCDIYSSSYSREERTNNKYICDLDKKQYDTLSEAVKNCSVEVSKSKTKYTCPDGSTVYTNECTMDPVPVALHPGEYTCSDPANYTLKGNKCVAKPIKSEGYCPSGTMIGEDGNCYYTYSIIETDGLSDSKVGVIIGECQTTSGEKVGYHEISKNYTCGKKTCDSGGGNYYYTIKKNGKNVNECVNISCCVNGVCISKENGAQTYYYQGDLHPYTNPNICIDEKEICEDSEIKDYYYPTTINGVTQNKCIEACYDSKEGKFYYSDKSTIVPNSIVNKGLFEIISGNKEEICPSNPPSSECETTINGTNIAGWYSITTSTGTICPYIKCCYEKNGSPYLCQTDPTKGTMDLNAIFNYNNSLRDHQIQSPNDPSCNNCLPEYTGLYTDDKGNCFSVACCTEGKGTNVCLKSDGEEIEKSRIKKVDECPSDNMCYSKYNTYTYRYKNVSTPTSCFNVACCYEDSNGNPTQCKLGDNNLIEHSSLKQVTNKKDECEYSNSCDENLGGRYAIPSCDGECLACVDIKCCESTSPNAICYDNNGKEYNRSGITYIGEDGTCDNTCDCDECEEGDEDCPGDSCPNCKLSCGPEGCKIVTDEEDCPLCDFKCFNCIFNNETFNLTTKQISTTVMNEIANLNKGESTGDTSEVQARQYGYNWITKYHLNEMNLPKELLEKIERITDKATSTVEEIGVAGETIYGDYGEKVTDSSALAFSIEMTPAVTNYLRSYNAEHVSDGGYGNETLKCYHDIQDGEVRYKYIYCFSTVIDDMLSQQDIAKKITISDLRVSADNIDARKTNANTGYWTLWDKEYGSNVIGGPAWK